ncbi:small ribosomal subunit protein uS15m [Zootoca vivipara]|uniref:small ribosomal subunit protein uS15m n=1 Tax=Zootoca vivipara TaxID=8524 RepID=UPI00293BECC1|nr:small ribosomal subunit protein uS15m [Zootoca vivipara]
MSLVLLRGVSAAGVAALRGWSCLGSNVAAAAAAGRGSLHKSPLLQTARDYARPVRRKKQEIPSHLDDLPPTMLKKPYANIPVIDKVDDVVKRLLSLEMASQKEKVKIKKQQLADQVRTAPTDTSSLEVQVAFLTAKIRTLQEHLHIHTKDTTNRRQMFIAIDRRKMLLKYLRNTKYDVFEKTCKVLDIKYEFPPLYCRRATRRWMAKKALCNKVYQEVKKLKAPQILKQRQEWLERTRAREAEKQASPTEGSPV